MIGWNSIVIGLKQILAHKFRSFLTMLGIVLGVASLVATAAIIKGMENGLMERIVMLGGIEKVWINEDRVPSYQEHLKDISPGLTMKDVHALQTGAPLLQVVSPRVRLVSPLASRNGKQLVVPSCNGVWPAALKLNLHELKHGRFFTDLDEKNAHSVCVIGTGIRDALFGTPVGAGREIIPLGEVININGQPFTVVGMFKHYERERTRIAREREQASKTWSKKKEAAALKRLSYWDAFWGKNAAIYVPLNTMKVKLRTDYAVGRPDQGMTQIGIKARHVDQVAAALQQVRNVLMRTHVGIEDFSFNYFQGRSLDDVKKRVRDARISGWMIAGLSLLVGGIGIMNIMLASINERIREIGICKAIGATGFTVFLQVLAEGVVLALLGAMAGLAASFALVDLLDWASAGQVGAAAGNYSGSSVGNTPVITAQAMLVAIALSAMVGVVAGLFPAYKAARLNPIEALRYE